MRIIHATSNVKRVAGIYNFMKTIRGETFLLYKGTPSITSSLDHPGIVGWRAVISELRKCDILHFHTTPAISLIILAKLCGVKIVRTVHFVDKPMKPRKRSEIKGQLIGIRNYFFRTFFIDRWVAVSQQCGGYIKSRWGADAQVIYNGVDTDFFQPSAEKEQIRQRLGFGEERLFVTVGQLVPRKRFVELIEDFKDVPGTLLIVGDGPTRSQLSGENVKLLGQLDRNGVLAVLQASDVYVHSALFEAFGLAVAEAQSVGLPAIVIEGSGAAEIVEHQVTGLVAPVDGFTEAMLNIKVTGSPRARAMQHFSAKRMREDYQSLYADLLRKPA